MLIWQVHRELHQACKDNDFQKVQFLVESGQVKLDYPDEVSNRLTFHQKKLVVNSRTAGWTYTPGSCLVLGAPRNSKTFTKERVVSTQQSQGIDTYDSNVLSDYLNN